MAKDATLVTNNDCYAEQVNPDMISQLENAGLSFVGKDETGRRMEVSLYLTV